MPLNPARLRATIPLLSLAAALLLTVGCSVHKATKAYDEGRYEDAVKAYREVLQKNPTNVKARMGYQRAAMRAAEQHLDKAKQAELRGQEDLARQEVRQALVLDPTNTLGLEWLARLETAHQQRLAESETEDSLTIQRAKGEDRNAILLNPRSLEGTDLNFVRQTSLKEIFAVLSKASGVSIIFHKSFPQDIRVAADLRGLSFQRILDTLMLQSDLLYRVVDTNTIMVFQNSQQNREQLENMLIKTFYLSNAEVDSVRAIFQTLLPQMKVYPDKRLNAVTVKAKPQELTIAKRVVDQVDKAKAEVMIYLELLEVTENSMEQVGLLPVISRGEGLYTIGAYTKDVSPFGGNESKGLKVPSSAIRYALPFIQLDALKSSGDAKMVASPHLRVISGESGEVNIGEKVSTTQSQMGGLGNMGTSNTTPNAGATAALLGGTQTQYSYEDVGVKIKVEPRVHFNNDITLKIESKVTTQKSGSTPGRPDLGQREIKTVARLKDGETVIFGGLLREDEQKSLQGVWGLTDVPILGKLLGSTRKNRAKTDVLLTIRTVLVRKPDLAEKDFEAFDPELATSKSGHFVPKTPKAAAQPGAPAGPIGGPSQGSAPAQPQPSAPGQPQGPRPTVPALPTQPAPPMALEPEESALVLFLAPVSAPVLKGDSVALSLLVSNGAGFTNGSLDLRIDPKVKVVSITEGDFLTSEGGVLEQSRASDGSVKLSFRRTSGASDSGTLAVLELEGVAEGNAPVLIQNGKYFAGKNPISGRVVNALVIVE